MWYIGQEVVCIKTHSKGVVIEDKIYVVKGISGCKCGALLDVGIIPAPIAVHCTACGITYSAGDAWWIGERLFVPLDSLMKEEIEELMKVETIFGVKI